MKIVTTLEYGKGINGEQYETVQNYEYEKGDLDEMTPLETLQKYGLKTDVPSIKERLEKDDYYKIVYESAIQYDFRTDFAHEESQRLKNADLALLCELAEKGEQLAERDKPMLIQPPEGSYVGVCPSCGWNLEWAENIRSRYSFCPECGQRLTWDAKESEGEQR